MSDLNSYIILFHLTHIFDFRVFENYDLSGFTHATNRPVNIYDTSRSSKYLCNFV
jgi:hypothetical protein